MIAAYLWDWFENGEHYRVLLLADGYWAAREQALAELRRQPTTEHTAIMIEHVQQREPTAIVASYSKPDISWVKLEYEL